LNLVLKFSFTPIQPIDPYCIRMTFILFQTHETGFSGFVESYSIIKKPIYQSKIMPKLYITCDHAAFDLKQKIVEVLNVQNIQIADLVPKFDTNDDYPMTAKLLAIAIKQDLDNGVESFGVALCGSGQGICMAINRFPFIRAAQPRTIDESSKTREHNNSNVMCFGCSTIEFELFIDIVKTFVYSPFSNGPRHLRRIEQMSEKEYTKF
jgi:ribose 5-phosphate isomerase B